MGRYGSGFAPPRLDPTCLDTRPKKTRLLPRPAFLMGTRLTRPDGYPTRPDLYFFKDFFNVELKFLRSNFFKSNAELNPVNVELNQVLQIQLLQIQRGAQSGQRGAQLAVGSDLTKPPSSVI